MNLINLVKEICNLHSRFIFKSVDEVIEPMKDLRKVNQIKHYYELVKNKYSIFRENIKNIISEDSISIFDKIKNNFELIGNQLSSYPLNFCHGDYKSPNIFYKTNGDIIILDWHYIHLGKGVSDLVFLLVESVDFDINTCNSIRQLYYKLYSEKNKYYSLSQLNMNLI